MVIKMKLFRGLLHTTGIRVIGKSHNVLFVVLMLVLTSLGLHTFSSQSSPVDDFNTPNIKDLVWTMDDLANATKAVIRNGTNFTFVYNVTIMPKDTLLIKIGQVLKFDNHTYLKVLGNLKAIGTVQSPILFTSSNATAAPGEWKGLYFDGSLSLGRQKSSILNYCIIEYAAIGVTSDNSTVTITNNIFRMNSGPEIKLMDSDSTVTGNDLFKTGFERNSTGILAERSSAVIDNNIINGTGGSGVMVDNDSSTISNNTITNVSISVLINNSNGNVINSNSIFNGTTGILIENSNDIRIHGNTVKNTVSGVSVNNSIDTVISSNDFTEIETCVKITNDSVTEVRGNTFKSYIVTGVQIGSNNTKVRDNFFEFIGTAISGSFTDKIEINNNLIENVTDGIVLDKASSGAISGNTVNYTTGTSILITNSKDMNISFNRIFDHFQDGLTLSNCDRASAFYNEIYFGHGISLNVSGGTDVEIIGNRIYYSFNEGVYIADTVPKSFTSNLITGSFASDLRIAGKSDQISLNNTFDYSRLVLGVDVKLMVINYFSVFVTDSNINPLKDVLIEILTNSIKTNEYSTDTSGTVKDIPLIYRTYRSQTSYSQDGYVLNAVYQDLEFDYSPFEINISKSTRLFLRANYLPELKILSPREFSTLSGVVLINGTAFDLDTPIKAVQMQVGSNPYFLVSPGNDDWTVWFYYLDTTLYPDGSYHLNFSASDGFSTGFNSIQVFFYNGDIIEKELGISITSPKEGEAVWNNITVRGSTTAGDRRIQTVLVQIDDGDWLNATPNGILEIIGRGGGQSRVVIYDWSNWTFHVNTRSLVNGEHIIRAIVSDGSDVAVDDKAMFVTNLGIDEEVVLHTDFESPENGARVNGTVFIRGIVWGCKDPVSDFRLEIDGRTVSNTVNVKGPNWWMWNYTWDTVKEKNGQHQIQVWARNSTIHTTDEITVITDNPRDNDTPESELSIIILKPTEGAVLSGITTVSGITWSENEQIRSVSVRVDSGKWYPAESIEAGWSAWRFILDTRSMENDIITIHAKLETDNMTLSTSVVVIVNNEGSESKLQLTITSPKNGSVVSGVVTVRGVAWYGDNSIISVDVQFAPFLWDTADRLRDDFSIWFYEWNTTTLDNGIYKLQCRVYDGVTTYKDEVYVEIQNEGKTDPSKNGKPNGGGENGSGDQNQTQKTDDQSGLIRLIAALISMNILIILFLMIVILRLNKKRLQKSDEIGEEDEDVEENAEEEETETDEFEDDEGLIEE